MRSILLNNIALYYWTHELDQERYFKQKMAMTIYNQMNMAGKITVTTLKEVWQAINLYYYLLSHPVHTCEISDTMELSDYYGPNRKYYAGD